MSPPTSDLTHWLSLAEGFDWRSSRVTCSYKCTDVRSATRCVSERKVYFIVRRSVIRAAPPGSSCLREPQRVDSDIAKLAGENLLRVMSAAEHVGARIRSDHRRARLL